MAVATPLTKVSASPLLPVFAALILLPSLSIFLGAGENTPVHRPKRIKIVCCAYAEGTHCSLVNESASTNLVQEQASQNLAAVAQNCELQLWPDFGAYNDTCDESFAFSSGDDIVRNMFDNLRGLAWKYRLRLLLISANVAGCLLLAREIAGARARRK